MTKLILLSLSLALFTTNPARSDDVPSDALKMRLIQQADQIGAIYDTYYAPKTWKEKYLGWNLANEVQKAKLAINNSKSTSEYRDAVKALIYSTADYHVSIRFFGTEKASLPFSVRTVEGHSIIVYINRKKLSTTAFPFQEGDELLSMDGKPVGNLLNEAMKKNGHNVEATDRAIADSYLTARSSASNTPVPHGPVTLSILSAHDSAPKTVQLAWDYAEEKVPAFPGSFSTTNNGMDSIRRLNFFKKATEVKLKSPIMVSEDAESLEDDSNNFSIGNRNPFLPPLGEKIWQTDSSNEFDAYIYQNAQDKLIGVIRISNYDPDDADKAVVDFAALITKMQKLTSALVIDQNNNPGGSIFYMYTLASMLTDKALLNPRHKMALSPEMIQEAATEFDTLKAIQSDADAQILGHTVDGYPITYEFVVLTREHDRFLLSEWNKGHRLTDPFFIGGVDQINPSKVHYTKPIVLLTNMLDFSCADFFPAIMQDNKRVTIVGTRTAGAGGYIRDYSFYNDFGLQKIRVTGSIAERADKNPIENLGILPDVNLPMTLEDYRDGFSHYSKAVNDVVTGLIK